MKVGTHASTNELLNELSDLEDSISHYSHSTSLSGQSVPSGSRSTPSSNQSVLSTNSSKTSRKRLSSVSDSYPARKKVPCIDSHSVNEEKFYKLPVFSPDVQLCIRKDAFYTSTQRNRLIKEACVSLRGYCWEKGQSVSNDQKKMLAKMLYNIAPKSLGDPGSDKRPEVSF